MNVIPPSQEAISTINAYPLAKIRTGMPSQEYTSYKTNWYFFNNVWAYNYTVSTMNGSLGSTYPPYEFLTNDHKVSYLNGQTAHVAYYSNAGSLGVFNNFY